MRRMLWVCLWLGPLSAAQAQAPPHISGYPHSRWLCLELLSVGWLHAFPTLAPYRLASSLLQAKKDREAAFIYFQF